jgi:TetR/AcrR family transcriptional regulator, fatty acid metabolism regulator protein
MRHERGTRGEARRARLLQAAARIFGQEGYHAAKVSTIVADAGVTQPTFYMYFTSKEAIFAELVAAFRARFRELILEGRLERDIAPADAIARIRGNIAAIFQFLAADPNITRIGLLQAPDAESIKQELVDLFAAKLASNQAAGYIRPEIEVEVIAEAIAGMVERLTVRYLLTGERDPVELAQIVADFTMTGTLAHGPDSAGARS